MNLPVELKETELDLTFLGSTSILDIENGIKNMHRLTALFGLIKGLAINRIERDELWRQAGFSSLWEYRRKQPDRVDAPASTISLWRLQATGYEDNLPFIEKYQIDLHKNVSKLQSLSEALTRYPSDLVAEKMVSTSLREWEEWLAPKLIRDSSPVEVVVRNRRIIVDGSDVVTVAKGIPPKEQRFVVDVLRNAYEARRGNYTPLVLGVKDKREEDAVRQYLAAFRK